MKRNTEISNRDVNSEVIRQTLESIAYANNGYLKPELVVEAASDPMSPIHDRFEWDDTEAARYYRNVQAGVLIRTIKIHIVRKPVEASQPVLIETTRAFQSLPSDRSHDPETHGSFQPVEKIMTDPEKRQELLATALKELAAYRKRYSNIAELAGVWKALDKAAAKA